MWIISHAEHRWSKWVFVSWIGWRCVLCLCLTSHVIKVNIVNIIVCVFFYSAVFISSVLVYICFKFHVWWLVIKCTLIFVKSDYHFLSLIILLELIQCWLWDNFVQICCPKSFRLYMLPPYIMTNARYRVLLFFNPYVFCCGISTVVQFKGSVHWQFFRRIQKSVKSDSFIVSVHPSISMEQLGSYCMDFHEILYWSIFWNSM